MKSSRGSIRQLGVGADREHVVGDAAEPDRVAVRRRFRDRIRAQHAAGAGLVLDHEGLPGQFAHLLAEHARERVGGAAGRKAVDIFHLPDRPGLSGAAETRRQPWRGDRKSQWLRARDGGSKTTASISSPTRHMLRRQLCAALGGYSLGAVIDAGNPLINTKEPVTMSQPGSPDGTQRNRGYGLRTPRLSHIAALAAFVDRRFRRDVARCDRDVMALVATPSLAGLAVGGCRARASHSQTIAFT